MEIKEILLRLQEMYMDVHAARNLLRDGKVIKADNKMQGIMTKLGHTIREIGSEGGTPDADVADKSIPKEGE